MSNKFKIDEKVIVNKRHVGVIRYVGPVEFSGSTEPFFGVELEQAMGSNNGTVDGVSYFKCAPNHGVFVRAMRLEKFTTEAAASNRITSVARAAIARRRAQRELLSEAFNALDNDMEHQQLERRQNFQAAGLVLSASRSTGSLPDVDEVEVEPEYEGPHISFPLKPEMLLDLIEHFKAGHILHYKYTVQILEAFKAAASKLPTLVHTGVDKGTTLAVCGDTHGQLQDLLTIWHINGLPSPTNRYLMNGDFVDRGVYGVEVVLLLFVAHLLFPESMLMNRGNHEDRAQNDVVGFRSEVLYKYNGGPEDVERGIRVYDLFEDCFEQLPLAHVIHNEGHKSKVLVLHGGLSSRRGVTLEHLAGISRKRPIPWKGQGFEDKLFEDIMWSDPKDDQVGVSPSDRGAGVFFGADITSKFCKANGLTLVVRSHEMVQLGYKMHHRKRLMTIFSASRYMNSNTNRGAYLLFESNMKYAIHTFVAGRMDNLKPKYKGGIPRQGFEVLPDEDIGDASVTFQDFDPTASEEAFSRQEMAVRSMVVERICRRKGDLFWYFSQLDKSQTGTVSKLEWVQAMESVLGLVDVKWGLLASRFATIEPNGRINYAKFLDRYRIEMRPEDSAWQEEVLETICERLYECASNLEQAYKVFDINEDGKITVREFVDALEKMNVGLSKQQVYDLIGSMDKDKDSHIDFAEFSNRFHVVFTRVADPRSGYTAGKVLEESRTKQGTELSATDTDLSDSYSRVKRGRSSSVSSTSSDPGKLMSADAHLRTVLGKLGDALFKKGNAPQVFADLDINGDGNLSFEEFKAGIEKLNLKPPVSDADIKKIMKLVDENDSGNINYLEFIQAFKIADVKTGAGAPAAGPVPALKMSKPPITKKWQQNVIDQVVNYLYEYRVELRAAFDMFDRNGDGKISAEEFRVGLKALTAASGHALTDVQAEELLKALDRNGDGELDYVEFLSTFRLVDTGSSGDAKETFSPTVDSTGATPRFPPISSRSGGGGGGGGSKK